MKKPIDKDRLKHILDAIERIEQYLVDQDLDRFRSLSEKIDAVVRNMEIIGEAISCLTQDLKERHPAVEWRIATAMRNRLIHGYFDVDSDIVWQTATADLPRLKVAVVAILRDLEK